MGGKDQRGEVRHSAYEEEDGGEVCEVEYGVDGEVIPMVSSYWSRFPRYLQRLQHSQPQVTNPPSP